MTLTRMAGPAVLLVVLAGCASTPITEYRNPEGHVRVCQPNVEVLTMGALLSFQAMETELARYRACQAAAEQAGYARTPAGQETEETKQLIRDADNARADSIRQ